MMESSLNPAGPDYVAALYAYLASDAAKAITGRVFWGMGGFVGQFHKNADELLMMRDHEIFPPYTLDEIHAKFATPALQNPDEMFNVVLKTSSMRLLLRQAILLKLGNSRLVKYLQESARKRHRAR